VSSNLGEANLSIKGFEPQKRNVAEVLGDGRVTQLVGDRITEARSRLNFWAAIAIVAYVAGAGAAVASAFFVPDLVRGH
jgi:hypothetical protein